ncbi:cache domain-containing protein [Billgrantia sp. Q4P2]|uniref:cache domain-containing protein n=1 Tax=Billgrantia sp. Q4P2 TaxID=3463857 RepID=UPI004056F8DB
MRRPVAASLATCVIAVMYGTPNSSVAKPRDERGRPRPLCLESSRVNPRSRRTTMRHLLAALAISTAVISAPAQAAERGTMAEAQAMAERAAAFLKEHGRDAAREAFSTKGGEWHDRDLYVFSMTGQAVMTSHGQIESMVGNDTLDMTDAAGQPYRREMVAIQDADWVDYLFRHPQTGEIEPKSSYCIRALPDDIVCVGAYKE